MLYRIQQELLKTFYVIFGLFPWPARSPDLSCQTRVGSAKAADAIVTATAGSDVVQSGRPIFDDFFQHLWPFIGNNTANVVFQMVKRLWLIIDQ
ncbi:hypothetical protein TNCV_1617231 [Trichonephila clavipes]|nr:hypothetical protein TNCV_1617231 [Trichonephila clavipes]